MAWTTPPSFSVGQLVTASALNTNVKDNLRYLKGLDGQIDLSNSVSISGYLRLGSTTAPGRAVDLGTTGNWSDSSGMRLTGGSPGIEFADTQATPQRWLVLNGTSTPNDGIFSVYDLKGSAAALSITPSTRRVGIGVTAPLSKLDVNGGVCIGGLAGVTAAPTNGLIVSGTVGIGTGVPAPNSTLHAMNGTTAGQCLFWSGATSGSTALTIAPNATVTGGIFALIVGRVSAGGTFGTTVSGGSGTAIALGGSQTINTTVGSDVLTLAVTAAGAITLQRTAGSYNHTVSLWIMIV